MITDDYMHLVTSLLGITPDQLLGALLWLVTLAPVVSWLRPRVDPVLSRWRDAAALTRTTADDHAVRVVTLVWTVLAWVPQTALRIIPIFATPDEVERIRDERRERRLMEQRR